MPFRHLAICASFALLGAVCEATDLNLMLRETLDSGKRVLQLPDGDVKVDASILLDSGVDGLEIKGGKATRLIFSDDRAAFFLNGCRNLALKSFAIDYDPLPFTQGTIEAIDGVKISFKVHDGYPSLTPDYLVKHALFFSRESRNWIWDDKLNYTLKVDALDARNGVVTLAFPNGRLKPGDFICLNKRVDCAIKIRGMAGGLLFEDLEILAAPDAAIISRRSDGPLTFRRVSIRRGPLPPGASEPRLISTCADGINVGTCRQGPLIEDCDLSFMGDDSVNFHGAPFPVLSVDGDSFSVVMPYNPIELVQLVRPGDAARILEPGSCAPCAVSEIVSIEPLGPVKLQKAQLKKLYPADESSLEIPFSLYKLRLKGAMPKPGGIVDVPAINAPGFTIKDCRFHDHRGRGLRIQASNGVIENCSFWNIEQSAISLGPEYEYWREAGWVSGIKVRGNSIRDVCRAYVNVSGISYFAGAISVFARSQKGSGYPIPANRDIEISDNRISGSGAAAIFLNAASDVSVKGNRFSNLWLLEGAPDMGSSWGISIKREPIAVFASENVTLSDNREEQASK